MKETQKELDTDRQNPLYLLPQYLVILNAEYEVIHYSREAERIQQEAGRPIATSMSFLAFVTPNRQHLVSSLLDQLTADHLSRTSEGEFYDTKGRAFTFEITYHPILNDQQELTQICILAREITLQKVLERKNTQLAGELTQLIENANAFVFGVDSSGYVTDWNKECAVVTSLEKEDVLAQKASLLVDRSCLANFEEMVQSVLHGGQRSNQEFLMNTRDDTVIVLLNATPKRNLSGQIVGVFFVGQDITELARYRVSLEDQVTERTQQLKEALQKEKGIVEIKNKFVSIASHEFKMPLASIESSVKALEVELTSLSDASKKLDEIRMQIQHMRALLEDILTLEKSDSTKLRVAISKVDLVHFLTNLATEIQFSTGQTHRILVTYQNEEPLFIPSNEKLLRNVFVNLFGNAVKFSPDKQQVEVTLFRQDSKVKICVIDGGIGIEPEDLARIFEPFNRGNNAGEIVGTGLGLSIVKKAVETLGGDLHIESKVGQGTRITVAFPLQ